MNIEQVCRHFKHLRENCDLAIEFWLKYCNEKKPEKVLVFLIFDDKKNVSVKIEEEKLKEYLDSLLLENSG